MSELISGKEAKLAWANGEDVECMLLNKWGKLGGSTPLSIFDRDEVKFLLKPRIITINGIEVPKNIKKHDKDDVVWVINTSCENWYDWIYGSDCDSSTLYWETEQEVKQVIEALRSIFK